MKKTLFLLATSLLLSGLVQAQQGSALRFNNTGQFVNVLTSTSLNLTKFTIETWLYWESSGSNVNFVCGKGIETLEIHTGGPFNGNIRFIPTTGVYLDCGANSIVPNTWVHLAFAYDPSIGLAKGYINGEEVSLVKSGANNLFTPVNANSNNLNLGQRTGGSLRLVGQLDEFRLWNKVLTQAEIKEKLFCEIPSTADGLVANYHFNQGTAAGINTGLNVLEDASGFNNNGTLVGFALTGTVSNWLTPSAIDNGASCAIKGKRTDCNVTLTVTGGVSYLWSGGSSPTSNINSFSNSGLYNVTITAADNSTSVVSANVVTYPISIVTQPMSQTICGTSTALFEVSATGSNLTYLWSNGNTNRTFTTSSAGNYRVSVTGVCGSLTRQVSNTVTLTKFNDVAITSQPQSVTVTSGNFGNLNVQAIGSNISYLWSNGATTPSISTSVPGNYLVTVSGSCPSVISNTVSLTTTLGCVEPSIVVQPTSRTICGVNATEFSVLANGTDLTYLWNTGQTTSSISTSVAGSFLVTITGGCGEIVSNSASLVIYDFPVIVTQPESKTICSGSSAIFAISATGNNISYLWSNGSTNTTISGGATNNFTATVAGACGTLVSNTASLVVNPVTNIVTQPLGQTVCEGTNPQLSVSATGTNLTYLWNNGETTRTINLVSSGSYVVTVFGACGNPSTRVSSNVGVEVQPKTRIVVQPTSKLVSEGSSATFTVSATGINVNYLWNTNETTPSINTTTSGSYVAVAIGTCGSAISNVVTLDNGTALEKVSVVTVSGQCSVTGISGNIERSAGVTIYPNPTSKTINISATFTNYTVKVFNLLGERLETLPNSINSYDVKNLSAGFYYLAFYNSSDGSFITTFKIVVEK